jgi:hypothetical protein
LFSSFQRFGTTVQQLTFINMHSKTITSLLVAAAAGITNAAPVDTPVGDYTWKISKFSGRKPEGTYYSSISQ